MAADPSPVRHAAPAKLNLYLHVLGRRADGYHLLDTLFAFCSIGDVVEASVDASLSLVIEGPFAAGLSAGDDNLVLRAARALAPPGGGRGARLRLIKNLPVAAGLGGGSADAAATLRALVELWDLRLDPRRLAEIAASLGADVPACLLGRPAFAAGVGDELAEAPPLPHCGVVLCNPGAPLRTPDVFARRVGGFSPSARFESAPADAQDLARLLRARRNDLTPGAVSLAASIAGALHALERSPGCRVARMSGSGATCFALYDDAEAAARAASALARAQPGWWVAATRFCDS
ncbi:MAG: 4-(cytidine 5'-diphospho)-2-C-methyl-D-erythritol kinase [Alphaproteobacteria bacterium]|nr:4-(cytidine 5'-diphospho)-2-C-methyl-D-erythritol kinase [Alphaproteobacteria bacterium]